MADKTDNDPVKEKLDVKIINTKKKKMTCCRCMFWTFSVLVGVIACFIGGIYIRYKRYEIPEGIAMNLGNAGVHTFKAFDRDGDGYISISEFEPLYHYFVNGGQGGALPNISAEEGVQYEQTITLADQMVTVVPTFKPLEVTSMMKDMEKHRGAGVMGSPDPLYGLKNWKKVNKKFLNLAARHFEPFFPKDLDIELGKIYYFIEQGFLQEMTSDLSSNRYTPPHVRDEHVTIHNLLTLFHPRPFLISRFKPRGSVACVRAKNELFIDIVFRIHAEFQLNRLPNFPFWFTPAQFTGHLIMTRDLRHIVHFNMYVPTNKKLNVDMEWLEGGDSMAVDIGYMPDMSLGITSPSVPANGKVLDQKLPEGVFDIQSIKWTKEIPEEKVLQILKAEMYPFQKEKYYNMTESLELAEKESKMMHHIVLWGALDDQSC